MLLVSCFHKVLILTFPLTDVVSIKKTAEHFRILYDVKGRFIAHRITEEEAKVRREILLAVSI